MVDRTSVLSLSKSSHFPGSVNWRSTFSLNGGAFFLAYLAYLLINLSLFLQSQSSTHTPSLILPRFSVFILYLSLLFTFPSVQACGCSAGRNGPENRLIWMRTARLQRRRCSTKGMGLEWQGLREEQGASNEDRRYGVGDCSAAIGRGSRRSWGSEALSSTHWQHLFAFTHTYPYPHSPYNHVRTTKF